MARLAVLAAAAQGLRGNYLDSYALRRRQLATVALTALTYIAAPPMARAAAAPLVAFDIPAGPLDRSLLAYAAQSHRQLDAAAQAFESLYDEPRAP